MVVSGTAVTNIGESKLKCLAENRYENPKEIGKYKGVT